MTPRPEKLAKSRMTSSFHPSHPEKRLDFRTAIEILRSRPEKLAKSRMTSSFCPPRPEKRIDSRTTTTQSRRSELLVELAQSALSGRPSYSPTALPSLSFYIALLRLICLSKVQLPGNNSSSTPSSSLSNLRSC